MYRLTIYGKPFGRKLSKLEAERRINTTRFAVYGIGMVRVLTL